MFFPMILIILLHYFLHIDVNVLRSLEVMKKFVSNGSKLPCMNFCKLLESTYNF